MKLKDILSEKEADNVLLIKVGEPYSTSYVNHTARQKKYNRRAYHACVPGIDVLEFQTGKQSMYISSSSSSSE